MILLTELKIALCAIVALILYEYLIVRRRRSPRLVKLGNQVPGPFEYPIFGNGLEYVMKSKKGILDLQKTFTEQYGGVYRFWKGNNIILAFSDIEHLQDIFQNRNLIQRGSNEHFHKFFGYNIFSNPLDIWRGDRKRLQPFFTKNGIEASLLQINDLVLELVEDVRKHVDGPPFDIFQTFCGLSFNVITGKIANYKLDFNDEFIMNLQNESDKVIKILNWKGIFPVLNLESVNYLQYKFFLNKMKDNLMNCMRRIISKGLEDLKKQEENSESTEPSILKISYDTHKKSGTEQTMVEELYMILMAGAKSTATTLSFLVLAIAMHPKIQEKLYEEIMEVFGDDDRPLEFSSIERLTYLDQTVKECERRFILLSTLTRVAEQDTTVGPYQLPAGVEVIINLAYIHYNEKFYPNPFEFNPDNFSPEAVEKRPKYAFMPFGGGPRICIGKIMAEIECKLAIVALLKNFVFHTHLTMEKVKYNAEHTLRSVGGFPVSLTLRNKKQTKAN